MSPDLAKRLQEMRENAALTQAEIAAATGVQRPMISRIESGQRDTTVAVLEAWVSRCDHEIAVIGRGTRAIADVAGLLHVEDQQLLIRLARLLPKMDPAHRVTLLAQLEAWEKYASSEAERAEQGLVKRAM